ncbi:ATP-binding SpoIIE family protein phosphatase [Kordiimonas lacus]|uniref:Histidine kinase-like ATPase domain-containing protein n=1 Tax=Kordiimonas lacus TaxID=637679 RepID=A0A1G7CDF9_9PROT|nr:fused response regulator/phosphatase [Kordiimonas lacus]SDE37283.1 Histidine kinase-like ATPase domain-containing protein [Kordiimonas lacus]
MNSVENTGIPGRVEELAAEVRGATILIVDDMAIMRQIIGRCLEQAGFTELFYAADGQDALDFIKETPPDLLILDLNMPRVTGYEVCRILQADPKTAGMPILVQSASETAEERVKVFSSGATDFVSKPINQPELLARVCMHLENKFLIKNLSDFQTRMQSELSMARDMQHSLLPDKESLDALEHISGMAFETHYKASFELGGDLWGGWALSDDEFGVFILDVSGHGVGAALNTFRLHATMTRFEMYRDDPASFLTCLNGALKPTFPLGHFVTMFYAVINHRTGDIVYAGAGAPRPMIVNTEGKVRLLDSAGTPVGILSRPGYENKTACLRAGETLICYSDVLLEAAGPDGAFLGEDGFVAEVESKAKAGKRETLLDRLLKSFYAKLPGELPDDLTALAIHRDQHSAISDDAVTGGVKGRVLVMTPDNSTLAEVVGVSQPVEFECLRVADTASLANEVHGDLPVVGFVTDAETARREGPAEICSTLGDAFIKAGGPIVLWADIDREPGLKQLQFDLNVSRIVSLGKGADALWAAVHAEADDYLLRLSAADAVGRRTAEIGDVDLASYRFRTREEAKNLATMLAGACAEPVPVALGLTELFVNAVEHGCLNIGHGEKGRLIEKGRLSEEIKYRRSLPAYADRYVTVEFRRTDTDILFRITDPGEGFDHQAFTGVEGGHTKKHGRGVTMAGGCFDEVTYMGRGNEVLARYRLR